MSKAGSAPRSLLFEFAFGGLAENLDAETRETLHIDTPIDEYLSVATKQGYRVILTGNPGDGKTQHLLMHRTRLPESTNEFYQPTAKGRLDSSYDIYYEPDGSRLSNPVVVDRLQTAVEHDIPGVLAINEGVIQEMIHDFDSSDYPFIDTLQRQIQNQLMYEPESEIDYHTELNEQIQSDIDNFGIVVIDLGLRNILTEETIDAALDLLETQMVESYGSENHFTANVESICNTPTIRENIVRFLQIVNQSTPDTHYTVRDLLQFLSAIITGGKKQGRPNFGSDLAYYNLIFEQPDTDRRGKIGSNVDDLFTTTRIVHPQIDAKLWTEVENRLSPAEDEDSDQFRNRLWQEFTELKREVLFKPRVILDFEFVDSDDLEIEPASTSGSNEVLELLRTHSESFDDFMGDQDLLYHTIRLVNQHFDRTSDEEGKLHLWTSQTYKSKSTDAFISRTDVRATKFECRFPVLNDELGDAESLDGVERAIEFLPDHYQLTFIGSDSASPVAIRIDSQFWESLQFLDVGIPYELRSDQQEQRLLQFMERVENRQPLGPTSGTVKIQDTAESNVVSIKIEDDSYEIEGE